MANFITFMDINTVHSCAYVRMCVRVFVCVCVYAYVEKMINRLGRALQEWKKNQRLLIHHLSSLSRKNSSSSIARKVPQELCKCSHVYSR